MDIMASISDRHSVREYTSQDIFMEDLGRILEAGRLASSSGNIQNWSFIIVTDEAKKKEIAKASMDQLWMIQAPVFIVVLSDLEKAKKYFGERGEFYSAQNCAMACENIILTATSLGIGSCFVSAFIEERIREIVGAPDSFRAEAVITLGYESKNTTRSRKASLYSKVSFQTYGNKIEDMDKVMWDYNLLGKGIDKSKKAQEKLRTKVKDFFEKLKGQLSKDTKGTKKK